MTPMDEDEEQDMTVCLEPNLGSLLASCNTSPMVPNRSSIEEALSDRESMQVRAQRAEKSCRELRAENEELRASRNWLAQELELVQSTKMSSLKQQEQEEKELIRANNENSALAQELAAEKDETQKLRIELRRARHDAAAQIEQLELKKNTKEEDQILIDQVAEATRDAIEARAEASRANREILDLRAKLAKQASSLQKESLQSNNNKKNTSLTTRATEERIRTLESLLEQYAKSHEENAHLRKQLEAAQLKEDEWLGHFPSDPIKEDKEMTPAARALSEITKLQNENRQIRLELSEALASSRTNATQSAYAVEAEAEATSKCKKLETQNVHLKRDLDLALAARAVDARELASLRRLLGSTIGATDDDVTDLRNLITEASAATDKARAAYDTLLTQIQNQQQEQIITSTHKKEAVTIAHDQVRVVHMIRNPLADAMRKKDQAHITQKDDTSVDSTKLHARLKERFREHLNWFREAVYLLTGFKLEMTNTSTDDDDSTSTTVRLRSMFAENPDDALLFRWTDDGIQLIDTPFARNLDDRLFAPLRYLNSTPAFLATIQLDLFEKSTLLPSS